ncbi:hypothetical protein LZ30DRAFT_67497 [Colletotrichum cereale]|nr:hypothetical protein LZ30DRAFT_67497 [Colletotrichum cereale]
MHNPILHGEDAPKHKRPRPSVQSGLPPRPRSLRSLGATTLLVSRPASCGVWSCPPSCARSLGSFRLKLRRKGCSVHRPLLSLYLVSSRRNPLSHHYRHSPSPLVSAALACGLDPLCAFRPLLFWQPVCAVTACRAKPSQRLDRFREGQEEQDAPVCRCSLWQFRTALRFPPKTWL